MQNRMIDDLQINGYPELVLMKLDTYLNRKGELCANYLLKSYSF